MERLALAKRKRRSFEPIELDATILKKQLQPTQADARSILREYGWSDAEIFQILPLDTTPLRWRETAKEPPTAADAINEDGDEIVLAWTNPESPFAQARPYNAISWQSVIQFPNVYSFWQPITQKR